MATDVPHAVHQARLLYRVIAAFTLPEGLVKGIGRRMVSLLRVLCVPIHRNENCTNENDGEGKNE